MAFTAPSLPADTGGALSFSTPPPASVRPPRIPRRWAARFTEEEDHNPQVLEDCSDCAGRGSICVENEGVAELGTCPSCAGAGITGAVVRFFPDVADGDEAEEAHATGGHVTCPRCDVTFALDDPRAWTGLRHLACGQKIKPWG